MMSAMQELRDYDWEPCGRDDTAVTRQNALNSYRTAEYDDSDSDSSVDSSVDGYDSDESLGNIYDEIMQLQQTVASQRAGAAAAAAAAPAPPACQPSYGIIPQKVQQAMGAQVITSSDNSQVVVLKNLGKMNAKGKNDYNSDSHAASIDSPASIDAIVIPDEYDVQYDSGGFPFVVPRSEKSTRANIVFPDSAVDAAVPLGHVTQLTIDKPDPPPCPQHGPASQQGCPAHQVICPAHPHGNSICPAHNGDGVQMVPQRVLIRRKKKARKGKTLFEKLIA